MAQSDSKVLILGALAGVAGVGLAVACYQGYRSRRRHSMPVQYLSSHNSNLAAGPMYEDGTVGLSRGQVEVLNRLEALIQCVSELKEEMKALKTALPTIQEVVKAELGGPETQRVSPLHRTRAGKRKRASTAITGDRSSEEAESEGGYITALTDSDEDEQSNTYHRDKEPPVDNLSLLFEKIECLHQGSESEKKESLDILLEKKEENCV